MISTFDVMSNGRICVNLIAGQSEIEIVEEGIKYKKEDRYMLMDEEVTILKALWTADEPLHFEGQFHQLKGARSYRNRCKSLVEVLSRRRFGRSMESIRQAFRRTFILGRYTRTD